MSPDYNPQVDYYELLQVHPQAETAVIRSAYRAILRELHAHPDLGGSHERAVLINEAYRVLSDVRLREEYNCARQRFISSSTPASEAKPPPSSRGWQQIVCPTCGRRNRLRANVEREKAVCGACRSRLFRRTADRSSAPQPAAEENRLGLPETTYNELKVKGELELRLERVPRGGKIVCRRCRRVWTAPSAGSVPRLCPACGAADWNSFRLFRCRFCGFEFTTASLRRKPYLLFPKCPGCARPHWHPGLESGPLSSLRRLLKG